MLRGNIDSKSFTIIFIIIAAFCISLFKSRPLVFLIDYTTNNFPFVKATIENNDYPFHLGFGAKYDCSITDADFLEKIQKKKKGKTSWKQMDGREYQGSLYQIQSIRIGNLSLKNVLACFHTEKDNNEIKGRICLPRKKMSYLFDFKNNRIYGIKRKNQLADLGVDLKKMTKIKCRFKENGLYFDAYKGSRKLNFLFGTLANVNLIKDDIHKDFIGDIRIGEKVIKNTFFHPISISSDLGVDGALGTNFFKKHLVFFDSKNQEIYIGDNFKNALKNSSTSPIPIEYTVSGQPVIEIKTLGTKQKVMIDTASEFELDFSKNVFKKELEFLHTTFAVNAQNDQVKAKIYLLPSCSIGKNSLKGLSVMFSKFKGVRANQPIEPVGKIKRKDIGKIGYPILYRTNLYFDFPHQLLRFIGSESDLKKIPIHLESMHSIPFEMTQIGLCLKGEISEGNFRFILDTGSSVSWIRPERIRTDHLKKDGLIDLIFESDFFRIRGKNFGQIKFNQLEMVLPEDVDGIIGMDFLRDKSLYIDFPNKKLYLSQE